MSDAKVLTTDEVERWQEFLGDGIQLRRTLATTRALETAVAELDSARFARDRYANTIGLIESAIGFSGAHPVEETVERVRRLKAECDDRAAELADRYDAKQAVANAEAERDAARRELAELALDVGYGERPEGQNHIIHADGKTLAGAWLLERKGLANAEADCELARERISALETALLDACREKVVHGHTTTLWTKARRLDIPGLHELYLDADRLNSEHKTLVAELVAALEGVSWSTDPSCWCSPSWRRMGRGHSPGCDAARAVLAKAKSAA